MSEPFLAEIRIFGFDFAPRGWAFCDGQILPINQNQSLYSLLGTTYGGDGRTSFALPDLRGRVPMHKGSSNGVSHSLGQESGEEGHVLSVQEMPAHDHALNASTTEATTDDPDGNLLAPTQGGRFSIVPYGDPENLQPLHGASVTSQVGQAHENMQPYLTVSFAIAIMGLFPSWN
jgi:microcystin-dependent protein